MLISNPDAGVRMSYDRRKVHAAQTRLCSAFQILLLAFALTRPIHAEPPPIPAADLLSYDELVELYEVDNPSEQLQTKLRGILTTPFVSNQATASGTRPLKPNLVGIGRHLRIAHWNIERGLEYETLESAFSGPLKFASVLENAKGPIEASRKATVLEQAALLKEADVIVLNEADWGMKRSGYRNVAADLAATLKMNYAYGVEFIEVDPIALGTEKFESVENDDREALANQISVDPKLYKGLHGNAILSRYPLVNVRLVPFREQGHDWYTAEKRGVTKV